MKTFSKVSFALLLVAVVYSCKQADTATESISESKSVTATDSVVSSSAAIEKKGSTRKFVRTADIKFKVKNVAKSTTQIENTTTRFGGFVTYTNLQSTISDEDKIKISPDSSLVTKRFTVENAITIRVPNTQLDTVIKTIAKQINFLNYRVIKADDVTLQMLSNKMAQKRSISTQTRIATAIETKGKKLNQIITAEENLNVKKEQNDNHSLENLSLEDQVNFSTLTLQIYQDKSSFQEIIANEKSSNRYRPNIGFQIWDSLKTGWFMLETIIAFVVQLWALVLIGILGYIGYKKFIVK